MGGIATIDKEHKHITGLLEPVADKCEGGANSQRALHGCSRNGPRSWLILSSCHGCPTRAHWRSSSCDVDSHSHTPTALWGNFFKNMLSFIRSWPWRHFDLGGPRRGWRRVHERFLNNIVIRLESTFCRHKVLQIFIILHSQKLFSWNFKINVVQLHNNKSVCFSV